MIVGRMRLKIPSSHKTAAQGAGDEIEILDIHVETESVETDRGPSGAVIVAINGNTPGKANNDSNVNNSAHTTPVFVRRLTALDEHDFVAHFMNY